MTFSGHMDTEILSCINARESNGLIYIGNLASQPHMYFVSKWR